MGDEFKVFDASPKVMGFVKKVGTFPKAKYPWKKLLPGQSFAVPHGSVKLSTLQSLAYKTGKRMDCLFVVVNHGSDGFEVGRPRIEDSPKPEVSNWVKPVLPPGYEMNAHGLIRSPEGKYYHDIKDIPK